MKINYYGKIVFRIAIDVINASFHLFPAHKIHQSPSIYPCLYLCHCSKITAYHYAEKIVAKLHSKQQNSSSNNRLVFEITNGAIIHSRRVSIIQEQFSLPITSYHAWSTWNVSVVFDRNSSQVPKRWASPSGSGHDLRNRST